MSTPKAAIFLAHPTNYIWPTLLTILEDIQHISLCLFGFDQETLLIRFLLLFPFISVSFYLSFISISAISLSRLSLYLSYPSISAISLSRLSLYLSYLSISAISLSQLSLYLGYLSISISAISLSRLSLYLSYLSISVVKL